MEIEIDRHSGLLFYAHGVQASIDLGSIRSAIELVDPDGFDVSRYAACMLREIMAEDEETDKEA